MNICLIVAFIGFVIFFNAAQVYKTSSGLYSGVQRITSEQLEATEWMDKNLPEEAIVLHQPSRDSSPSNLKGWVYQKMRWKHVLSHRALHDDEDGYNSTHIMIDYSDFNAAGAQNLINILNEFESSIQNATQLYNQNGIKVYELG
jgi:hypothetical protein